MREEILREIKGAEAKEWKPQKQGVALGVIEEFVASSMDMAEVNLNILPDPGSKMGSKVKSSKQDSFSSSFYAWKKKESTKRRLKQLSIDVLIIRRGNKIALKKVKRIQKQ